MGRRVPVRCAFLVIVATGLFLACGGGDAGSGADADVPGADLPVADAPVDGPGPSDTPRETVAGSCLPSNGSPGAATATPGTAVVHATSTGTAQSLFFDPGSPMPDRPAGLLRRGPCGTVGLLFRGRSPQDATRCWMYADVTGAAGTPEVVDPSLAGTGSDTVLFFDGDCAPMAVLPSSSDGLIEYLRGTDGTWARRTTGSFQAVLGAMPTSVSLAGAHVDAGGRPNVVLLATAGGAPAGLHGVRDTAPGSAWTFARFDLPQAKEFQAFRVDGGGTAHALFTRTEYPCDPCDMDLYYGRLPPGGAWAVETVQDSKWGDPNDEYADDPWMEIDTRGEPIVAATYLVRVITGSLVSTQLRVYSRTDGAWCHETVATASDGYAGSDGTAYTGAEPMLALDGQDRPHVVFADTAQWHDSNSYANAVQGQARHAVRTGDAWSVATLFRQDGQTVAARPLHGFGALQVAVSPDGAAVHVAGVDREWDTDSIYNPAAVPITYRVTVAPAAVALP